MSFPIIPISVRSLIPIQQIKPRPSLMFVGDTVWYQQHKVTIEHIDKANGLAQITISGLDKPWVSMADLRRL